MGAGVAVVAATLAFALVAGAPLAGVAHAARAKTASTSTQTSKKRVALHQFTGVVTSVDKTSLTVEKGGKRPKTMVFTRHAEMSTQGDLARDAKVTVYYRDEDGKPVARKVVVKGEGTSTP
jgi:hypothetical protein